MNAKQVIRKGKKPLLALSGLAIGFLNGFFGGGGGMLCVPALSLLLKLETKQSHATALAVMLPLAVISAIVYLLSGTVRTSVLFPAGGGFIVGGIIGALLLSKLKNEVITIIFACVMIFAGVRTLI